jgi:hypothetical protein
MRKGLTESPRGGKVFWSEGGVVEKIWQIKCLLLCYVMVRMTAAIVILRLSEGGEIYG